VTAKARLSVYLEPARLRELEAFARRRGSSKSLVAEAAITAFLAPDDTERPGAALLRRLDRQARAGERLDRDLMILTELVVLFVRHWLTLAPVLPEAAQAAARARGQDRYQGLVTALGRRLAKGGRLTDELPAEDAAAPVDSPSPTQASG
jgi:predicted transcriptional regulator